VRPRLLFPRAGCVFRGLSLFSVVITLYYIKCLYLHFTSCLFTITGSIPTYECRGRCPSSGTEEPVKSLCQILPSRVQCRLHYIHVHSRRTWNKHGFCIYNSIINNKLRHLKPDAFGANALAFFKHRNSKLITFG